MYAFIPSSSNSSSKNLSLRYAGKTKTQHIHNSTRPEIMGKLNKQQFVHMMEYYEDANKA